MPYLDSSRTSRCTPPALHGFITMFWRRFAVGIPNFKTRDRHSLVKALVSSRLPSPWFQVSMRIDRCFTSTFSIDCLLRFVEQLDWNLRANKLNDLRDWERFISNPNPKLTVALIRGYVETPWLSQHIVYRMLWAKLLIFKTGTFPFLRLHAIGITSNPPAETCLQLEVYPNM